MGSNTQLLAPTQSDGTQSIVALHHSGGLRWLIFRQRRFLRYLQLIVQNRDVIETVVPKHDMI